MSLYAQAIQFLQPFYSHVYIPLLQIQLLQHIWEGIQMHAHCRSFVMLEGAKLFDLKSPSRIAMNCNVLI